MKILCNKMYYIIHLVFINICIFCKFCSSLDNGLALTPPMGFMSWQRFRCITDCEKYPDECISEQLFKNVADIMVKEGYKDAGYEYIIIDDCWLAANRTKDGKLQADEKRFPNGMKHLADYIHSKGLKFGLYEDYGNKTCGGYPGMLGHLKEDAELFASWEIDYIKVDGCYSDIHSYETGYPEFGKYLNETGRPIVYSCSWPAYQEYSSIQINFESLMEHCNLWRNYGDIDDSYDSVKYIMDYFAIKQDFWQQYSGPGHWNDPDMLIIGNYGLSYEQSKMQMAIWAILAAPLLISADLRNIRPELKEILLNKEIIAINQDKLGIQGKRVFTEHWIEIWVKPIEPVKNGYHSFAIAIVSHRTDGAPYSYNATAEDMGLLNQNGYRFRNLFSENNEYNLKSFVLKPLTPKSTIQVRINPTSVVLYRADVLDENEN